MNRRLAWLWLPAMIILTGCTVVPKADVSRTGGLPPPSSYRRIANAPKLYLEPIVDQAGGIRYNGPARGDAGVEAASWVDALVREELERLVVPLAGNRQNAQASLRVEIGRMEFAWNGGFRVPVRCDVWLRLQLKDAAGREIWAGQVSAHGKGIAGAGGVPNNGIKESLASARSSLAAKFGPALEEDAFPALKAGPVAAVALIPAAAAPERPRSDVDQLPAPTASKRKSHAVVIGIERYRESLPPADFAAGDARLAAEYFKRVLGIPEENLVLLLDDRATRADFEKYFERWLPNRVEAGDEVYVYYSGHGAPNPARGDAYIVPFDGDPTYIEQTGYSLRKLYGQLAKLQARKVVVAMDSCFSGAGGRSVIAKGARPLVAVTASEVPANVTVVSASAGDQISNSYQEKGHGLFTYYFLKGLKEKGADMKAVFDYLKPEVVKVARREYNADQEPQWREGK